MDLAIPSITLRAMSSPMFGEFAWTAILILLGDGVVAGVFTAIACGSSDAHLNPAVTLGSAVMIGDFSKVVGYSVAQLAGAILGAAVVWIHFAPHWSRTTDDDRQH